MEHNNAYDNKRRKISNPDETFIDTHIRVYLNFGQNVTFSNPVTRADNNGLYITRGHFKYRTVTVYGVVIVNNDVFPCWKRRVLLRVCYLYAANTGSVKSRFEYFNRFSPSNSRPIV